MAVSGSYHFRHHPLNFGGSYSSYIRFSPWQDAPIAATHRLYRSTETGSAPLAVAEVQERRSASGGSKRQKQNVASMSVSSARLFSYPNFQYTRRFSLPFLQQGFPIPKRCRPHVSLPLRPYPILLDTARTSRWGVQYKISRANDVTTKLIARSLTFYKRFEVETTVPPKIEQIRHPYGYTQFS